MTKWSQNVKQRLMTQFLGSRNQASNLVRGSLFWNAAKYLEKGTESRNVTQ